MGIYNFIQVHHNHKIIIYYKSTDSDELGEIIDAWAWGFYD